MIFKREVSYILILSLLFSVVVPSSSLAEDVTFRGLNDPSLTTYLESSLYDTLVSDLDSSEFFVENVKAIYISEEYLEELEYNTQENIYFGYSLSQLDEQFEGKRYVFTLGENNETVVKAFEAYDNSYYNTIIRNVSVGTGVILVCVTVSVLTAGAGSWTGPWSWRTGCKYDFCCRGEDRHCCCSFRSGFGWCCSRCCYRI